MYISKAAYKRPHPKKFTTTTSELRVRSHSMQMTMHNWTRMTFYYYGDLDFQGYTYPKNEVRLGRECSTDNPFQQWFCETGSRQNDGAFKAHFLLLSKSDFDNMATNLTFVNKNLSSLPLNILWKKNNYPNRKYKLQFTIRANCTYLWYT